jgi:hypothetical protein
MPRSGRSRGPDDRRRRTPEERDLLAELERRRAAIEAALEASNILHHRIPCACCGLPTIRRRGDYEVCVVCLWEDAGGEADPRRASAPNYTPLEQARLTAADHLRLFEADRGVDLSAAPIDPLVRAIKRFEAALRRGEVELERRDFAANLAAILAS